MYIKLTTEGWYARTAMPPFASREEELLKGNYWTDLYQYDWDACTDNAQLLRLVDNEIILGTQEDRDAYDAEQLELARIKARDNLKNCTKLQLFETCKRLNLLALLQGFKQVEEWEYTNDILLDHPAVIQAMEQLPIDTLNNIKYDIITHGGE
jgi:hypothetical protein